MLKKSVSIVFETCEAYLVKRRSFPDSDVSRTTTEAFLSILRERSPVVHKGEPLRCSGPT
jgi:hypothetical protein